MCIYIYILQSCTSKYAMINYMLYIIIHCICIRLYTCGIHGKSAFGKLLLENSENKTSPVKSMLREPKLVVSCGVYLQT